MKLILTGEEAKDIVWEAAEGWARVEDKITDHSRWSVCHDTVHKRLSDDKYFVFYYQVGATEQQDERPYEYEEEVTVLEVESRQVQKWEWKVVKDEDL